MSADEGGGRQASAPGLPTAAQGHEKNPAHRDRAYRAGLLVGLLLGMAAGIGAALLGELVAGL